MESILKDRYMRGTVAGGLAGFITWCFNLFAYHVLHITTLLWADFASAIVFRRKPDTIVEFIFSSIVTIFFTALLGVLFSLIMPIIKSKFLIFKTWVYGIMCWFLIYALTLVFRIPTLTLINSKNAMAHSLSASIWGILLGVFLKYLDSRLKKNL